MDLLRDESGFSLVELLFVCVITVVLMAALSTALGVGLNTSDAANNIIASQDGVVVALDRLDYEARCASSAALISSGSGVTLTLPSQCTHATGTVTWCVSGGYLMRYSGSSCSGTGVTLVSNVTSATPFSCVSTVGNSPELKAILTVSAGTSNAQTSTGSDVITLENAATVTSSSSACA
jgi:Tfp pilus assembly protein PilW